MQKSIKMTPTSLKANLETKQPNAPKSLESVNVGLKFQLKCLKSWTPSIKNLSVARKMRARQDKIVAFFMSFMWFEKDEPHEINKVGLHFTL
jgi:hypothetical protein